MESYHIFVIDRRNIETKINTLELVYYIEENTESK